ncbi:MAG: chorismate-binding protein [Burkholderiaceae bacterium]
MFRASFPAGTLTGAPKVRRPWRSSTNSNRPSVASSGGACSYLSYSGDMDVAIAIRTGVIKDGTLHVQAAAGIVFDSVPESEVAGDRGQGPKLTRAAELVDEGLSREL